MVNPNPSSAKGGSTNASSFLSFFFSFFLFSFLILQVKSQIYTCLYFLKIRMFNICLFENNFIKVYQTIFPIYRIKNHFSKCESHQKRKKKKKKKQKNTFQVYSQHKKYF
jgi:hypothetical protein